MTPLDYSALMRALGLFPRGTVTSNITKLTGLTMNQLLVVEVVERLMSAISIVASLFVLISYICFSSLNQKSVNRIIFLATWGNLMSNTGTLISVSGLKAGTHSSLCQVQAFLVQWFVPADTLWAFCLGLNVFLTFNSHKFNVRLRKLERFYCAGCYGIPLIPALIYFVLDTRYGHEIYGNATIWCWVTEEHKALRVATFYGPVWIVILATIVMYAVVGKNIYMNRVNNSYVQHQLDTGNTDGTFSTLEKGVLSRGLGSIVHTKEVSVVTRPYTPAQDAVNAMTDNTANGARQVMRQASFSALQGQVVCAPTAPQAPPQSRDSSAAQSTNRRVSIAPSQSPHPANHSRNTVYTTSISGTPLAPLNTAAMRGARTYAKVAFLLFIVMLVVWVPSSINRFYTFSHPPNFGMNVAAAAVLPLQGFFNCVIYCFTSREQLRVIWISLKVKMVKLPHTSAMTRSAVGAKKFPAELDGGDGQVPLKERRSDAQRRLHELDELDSRYDVGGESRIASPSGSPEELSPVDVEPPTLPVPATVSTAEEPPPVVFSTNGRVYTPPIADVPSGAME